MKTQRNFKKIRHLIVKKTLEGENIMPIAYDHIISRQFIQKWIKLYKKPPRDWWNEGSRAVKQPRRKVTQEIKEQIIIVKLNLGFNIEKMDFWLKLQGINLSHTTIEKVVKRQGETSWSTKNTQVCP